MSGFNITLEEVNTPEGEVAFTHKLVEAFKFAYSRRAFLGDPTFMKSVKEARGINITKVLEALLDQDFAAEIREKIKPDSVYPFVSDYGGFYAQNLNPYGTSHLAVLAENGDALSMTNTINLGYGSGIRGMKTGIIYNDEMDDFCTPGLPNFYGYPPTPANFIRPGKRPMSSMSGTIIADKNGDVVMVAGASGGSRIITGTSTAIYRKMFLGEDLGRAVSKPRVHHQLVPNEVLYVLEPRFTIHEYLKRGLAEMGHNLNYEQAIVSVVQAIHVDKKKGIIYAKSDPRKGKGAAGY